MLNRFPEAWKAIIAFIAPGAAMILTAITETSAGGESVTAGEWIGALATAVVVGGTVYAVPNRVGPRNDIASAQAPSLGAGGNLGDNLQRHEYVDGVLHVNGEPTSQGGYAQGGYTGDSKAAAAYHGGNDAPGQVTPGDVGFATYGDEPLPPASGRSGSSTAHPATGSKNYVEATDWNEAEHHGIEADQTPVASNYEPKHEEK